VKDRFEAESYFRGLRFQAYKIAEASVHKNVNPDVQLTEITEAALQQASNWTSQRRALPNRLTAGWDWRTEVVRFRRRPRRVEVAIWHNQTLLCGLALGRTSNNRVVATIHLLERNPASVTPIDGMIAPIAVRFLEAYARVLGCREIAVDQPFSALVPYYQTLGFNRLVTKGKRVLRMYQILTYP